MDIPLTETTTRCLCDCACHKGQRCLLTIEPGAKDCANDCRGSQSTILCDPFIERWGQVTEGEDWLVTVWVPFVVRVENMDDAIMAKSVAQDYLEGLDPLTGTDTLTQRLRAAAEPTVFYHRPEAGLVMEAVVAADTETYACVISSDDRCITHGCDENAGHAFATGRINTLD